MSDTPFDYDSIAEVYDLYVRADYDVDFFLGEASTPNQTVLELAPTPAFGHVAAGDRSLGGKPATLAAQTARLK